MSAPRTGPPTGVPSLADPPALRDALDQAGYLIGNRDAVAVWLAMTLERPLLVEGPPGVGKTELARALARTFSRRLISLPCHEGLDQNRAVFEWDHARQLLHLESVRRSPRATSTPVAALDDEGIYAERFLLERPLLAALRSPDPVVLLIDEIDRADESFEALLLEFLDRFEITVPEIGTISTSSVPTVILTSNDTRDLADATRRRCLRLGLGYPEPEAERQILRRAVPHLDAALGDHLLAVLGRLRASGLRRPPGVSEGIDWARAVEALGRRTLDDDTVLDTLPVILKHDVDVMAIRAAFGPPDP